MEWSDPQTFYPERTKLAKGSRRFTHEQRERLVSALMFRLKPDEKARMELDAKVDELLMLLKAHIASDHPRPAATADEDKERLRRGHRPDPRRGTAGGQDRIR
jgi:hypothetical protein